MNDALLLILPDGRSRGQLSLMLRELGKRVVAINDPHEAMKQASQNHFPVAIVDRDLPGISGLEFVYKLSKSCPNTHVVLLSDEAEAAHTPPRAQLGVSDIIYRPFKPAKLMTKIEGLCSTAASKIRPTIASAAGGPRNAGQASPGEVAEPTQTPTEFGASLQSVSYSPSFLVCKSAVSRRFLAELWMQRNFETAILVSGEDGSEFELVVRELNQASGSADVYPAVLHEHEISIEALESLNTHARLSDSAPRLVFIPHIEALPEAKKNELLQFVSNNRQSKKRSIRLVFGSITNSDLATPAVEKFRTQLGDLCEGRLKIAPLRERRSDIPLIIRKILYDLTTLHSFVRAREVEDAALEFLSKYIWKGNYEQLITVMRSAISSCPYRSLSLHQVQSLLHNDLAALHLLESVADENLLPNK
ncbi:MAG: response regulator [Verrucomicrobiota bacterium]